MTRLGRLRIVGIAASVAAMGASAALATTAAAPAKLHPTVVAPAAAMTPTNCDPVLLTLAGSGQAADMGVDEMTTLATTVQKNAKLPYGRTVDWVPVTYPAVPVPQYLKQSVAVINGRPTVYMSNGLEKSEAAGMANLKSAISKVRQTCPSRSVMLAGYSQGADVVSRVVDEMSAQEQNKVSVAMLGNPSFLPGKPQDDGTYRPRLRGIRPTLHQPSFPITAPVVVSRTVDTCLTGDTICNFNFFDVSSLLNHRNAHYKYVSSGWAAIAGGALWRKALTTLPQGNAPVSIPNPPATSEPANNGLSISNVSLTVTSDQTAVVPSFHATNPAGLDNSTLILFDLGCKDASTGQFVYSASYGIGGSSRTGGTNTSGDFNLTVGWPVDSANSWSGVHGICWIYGAQIRATAPNPHGTAPLSTASTTYGYADDTPVPVGQDSGPALWNTAVNVG